MLPTSYGRVVITTSESREVSTGDMPIDDALALAAAIKSFYEGGGIEVVEDGNARSARVEYDERDQEIWGDEVDGGGQ